MNPLRRFLYTGRTLLSRDIYEPTYLEAMKPKVPMYDLINIQMRGPDFPVLESFQKFTHNLLANMDINVEDAWATPAQDLQVTILKPLSEIVNTQFNLKTYQRTLQISDLPCSELPTVIRAVEACTPAGVTVEVLKHEEWHTEVRYVPDVELKKLKGELEEMGGPSKKKSP